MQVQPPDDAQRGAAPRRRSGSRRRAAARAPAAARAALWGDGRTCRGARGSGAAEPSTRRRRRATARRCPRLRCRGLVVSRPSGPTGGMTADRRLHGRAVTGAAREHPGQHARVLAVAGPQEAPVGVLAEPVDVEDLRQLRRIGCSPDLQPVGEVVGHVVAAERQHRERVEAQLADGAGGGGGLLRAHDRAEEDAVLPVERLGHERHDRRATAAEQHRARSARRLGPPTPAAIAGSCAAGDGEARVGVRRRRIRGGRPVFAAPVDQVRGRLVGQPLPPHVAVVGEGAVGEDRVATRSS